MSTQPAGEFQILQAIRGQVVNRPIALNVPEFRTDPIPIGPGATRVSIDVQEETATGWIVALEWTLSMDLDATKKFDLLRWRPFVPTITIDASVQPFILNASIFGIGWLSLRVATPDPTAGDGIQAVFLIR